MCSEHFTDDCFETDLKAQLMLELKVKRRLFASEGKTEEGKEFMIAEGSELLKFVRYISADFRLKYLRKCVSDRI